MLAAQRLFRDNKGKKMRLGRIGSLVLLIAFLTSVIWLAVFPHEASRIFLNQHSTVRSFREVALAEQNYAAQSPITGYACELADLGQKRLVNSVLASGQRSGYRFEIQCSKDASLKNTSYTIAAWPTRPGITGQFAFCADQRGETWYSENGSVADCLTTRKPVERKASEAPNGESIDGG